jgi:hypothetical protein
MKLGNCLILSLSIAMCLAADKKEGFRPDPIDSYSSKQTAQGVTIAAVAFDDPEEAKKAFGKLNPYEHGVLPVLVLIRNDSGKALKWENLDVMYMAPQGRKVEATPAAEVQYLQGGARPRLSPSQIPTGGVRIKLPKNPLRNDVIVERAFMAKSLPPGDSAHGFFYFQTGHTRGTSLYLSGIKDAQTGQPLFFFEVPLD